MCFLRASWRFFYLDGWVSLALWHHLVLHTHPRMSINPSKVRLHLIFTTRWWGANENGIPSCKFRDSEPLHNPDLCLPGLKLCAQSFKPYLWDYLSSDLFLVRLRRTYKNCPPVHHSPQRSTRVQSLPEFLPRKLILVRWWLITWPPRMRLLFRFFIISGTFDTRNEPVLKIYFRWYGT